MGDHDRVLVRIAQMYYEEGATQQDIANKLNISRSLVSRYLSKAKDAGIVKITISDGSLQSHRILEEQIKRIFGLDDVICVEHAEDQNALHRRLGLTAAKYLSHILRDNSTIGVASGRVMHALASQLNVNTLMTGLTFVPLAGGLSLNSNDIQANVIAELLARKTGGTSIHLYAPVLVDSSEAKHVFMNQTYIRNVFDTAKNADIALVGIGGTPTYYEMTSAYLHKIEGPVNIDHELVKGDICYNFIDDEGRRVNCDWNDRVMSLDLNAIRDIPNVIGVSGGSEKHMGIYAAVVGKLINVLITDVNTCRFMLAHEKEIHPTYTGFDS